MRELSSLTGSEQSKLADGGLSRADVLTGYEVFLGRPPESEDVIAAQMKHRNWAELARAMLNSAEFQLRMRDRPAASAADVHTYAGYTPPDLAVFDHFAPFRGGGTPGFCTDFLGVRTSTRFSKPLEPFDGFVEGPPVPFGSVLAETAEYVGALRAVIEAGPDRFTMLECGAGYGSWMAITAAAARQRGIGTLRLHGVEGDPGHAAMLIDHMRVNGIGLSEYDLTKGAVGTKAGTAYWPAARDAAAVYGGRPVERRGDVPFEADLIEVDVYGIGDLLGRESFWDLLHIDIQGSEGEVCRAGMRAMSRSVRRVVIGTHSRALDGELVSLFHEAGWQLENEKPCMFDWRPGGGSLYDMTRVDGVQVWRNPKLDGR